MNKYLLVCFVAVVHFGVHAQTYDDLLRRERVALDNYDESKRSCLLANKIALEQSKWPDECMQLVTLRYAEETTLPAIKGSMKVLNFLWQQVDMLDKVAVQGKMSINEVISKQDRLFGLIKEEETRAFTRGLADLKSISSREAQIQSNRNLSKAIEAMGGVIQGQTVDRTTYVMNGQIWNCITVGSIVNCN